MGLPNLHQILNDVKERVKLIPSVLERLPLPPDIAQQLQAVWPHTVLVKNGAVDFHTSDSGALTTVVNANVLKAAAAVPLYRAMKEYRDRVFLIKGELRLSDGDFNRDFKEKKSLSHPPEKWARWKTKIDAQPDLDVQDKVNLKSFLADPNSLTSHKGLARTDWYTPAICKAVSLRVDYNGIVADISERIASSEVLYKSLEALIDNPSLEREPIGSGINIIVYGAPGTGKSYAFKNLPNVVRTVFHSEYRNSDFVGAYKPYKDSTGKITYEFIPGPFILAFVNALKAPTEQHNLVIEEINRATAASVFGEVFQLLDRSETGESEYAIPVERSVDDYLKTTLGDLWEGKLYIPKNLHLRASMNSADQGVEPMDSAFKRRWQFHYLPIEFKSSESLFFRKIIPYRSDFYRWSTFATSINQILREQGIEEDRLLGPYFLSRGELADTANIEKYISGKLFIYLWDDVLRHSGRNWIFRSTFSSFSVLTTEYLKKNSVFTDKLENLLVQNEALAETQAINVRETAEEIGIGTDSRAESKESE
jgi:AAA domain (dynein-related subfamily)